MEHYEELVGKMVKITTRSGGEHYVQVTEVFDTMLVGTIQYDGPTIMIPLAAIDSVRLFRGD